MVNRIKLTLLVSLILLVLSGCTTTSTETAKGTAIGTGVGAGLGVVLGYLIGDVGLGVKLGAMAGAPTGFLYGHNKGQKKQEMQDMQDAELERIQESEGTVNQSQDYQEDESPQHNFNVINMPAGEEIEIAYTREWISDHWTYTPTTEIDQKDLYKRVLDEEQHWKYIPFDNIPNSQSTLSLTNSIEND